MIAFALRSSGWYLRQDIIWNKPNPMPESVRDRCTKAHEYIFLLSKSSKYYFDNETIKVPLKESSKQRLSQDIDNQIGSDRVPGKTNGKMKAVGCYVEEQQHKNLKYNGQQNHSFHKTRNKNEQEWESKDGMANKKSVWTVTTKPFKEAHFATYPPDLIEPCILAGCPKEGIVLDPFMGAGTTGLVAKRNNRNYIGIELNTEYIKIAEQRILKG
jgi:DNA modification methylase